MSSSEPIPGKVYRVRYTTARRCSVHPNPKRPMWRCKNPPTWIWIADDAERDDRHQAFAVCDEHLDRLSEPKR